MAAPKKWKTIASGMTTVSATKVVAPPLKELAVLLDNQDQELLDFLASRFIAVNF